MIVTLKITFNAEESWRQEQALANYDKDVEEGDNENNHSQQLRSGLTHQSLYQTQYLIWPSRQPCKVLMCYLHIEDEKTEA